MSKQADKPTDIPYEIMLTDAEMEALLSPDSPEPDPEPLNLAEMAKVIGELQEAVRQLSQRVELLSKQVSSLPHSPLPRKAAEEDDRDTKGEQASPSDLEIPIKESIVPSPTALRSRSERHRKRSVWDKFRR